MAVFNEPDKWATTLGQNADVVQIPDSAGSTDPDIEKIFPAIFSVPLANGGRAISRTVLNGLFKLLGDWSFYTQNGGVPSYNADYDYIAGRVVLYNGNLYKCIQANGASSTVVAPDNIDPDYLGSDYWVQVATLADIANFANIDLSNLSATGQALFTNKADKDFTNIDNTAKIAIAHNAMPSGVYDDLTLGTSGTTYIAPADGYIYLSKTSSALGQYALIDVVGKLAFQNASVVTTQTIRFFVPVDKGSTFTVSYTLAGATNTFRFVYAVGSESEQ